MQNRILCMETSEWVYTVVVHMTSGSATPPVTHKIIKFSVHHMMPTGRGSDRGSGNGSGRLNGNGNDKTYLDLLRYNSKGGDRNFPVQFKSLCPLFSPNRFVCSQMLLNIVKFASEIYGLPMPQYWNSFMLCYLEFDIYLYRLLFFLGLVGLLYLCLMFTFFWNGYRRDQI